VKGAALLCWLNLFQRGQTRRNWEGLLAGENREMKQKSIHGKSLRSNQWYE
jgi:hypothetical protein